MAETHGPIPQRTPVLEEKGLISRVWYQFLYKIFGDIETRLQALETTTVSHTETLEENATTLTDHETRITALEP